jgi:histidyl-tRNA synthetase
VRGLIPPYTPPTRVYLAVTAPELAPQAQTVAGALRRAGVNAAVDFGERKLGDQIKTAAKHKIPWLIVVGEDELAKNVFGVKNLETGAEEKVPFDELPDYFKK